MIRPLRRSSTVSMNSLCARSLRTTGRGLGGPLAHCTPGETHKNSEIGVKVLVTGGTGFVGSHAVAALLRSDHRVHLLVRDASMVDDDRAKPRSICFVRRLLLGTEMREQASNLKLQQQ